MNKVFRCIHDLADTHQCLFITCYVASRKNLADGPSRRLYPLFDCLLPDISIPVALQQFVGGVNC
jgi:hypothetical protein